jgi:aryl-alcohol dehydrogenase-like predicted oxidoreductase
MPLTDYVTLGRSGLRVSPFCLGTMTFGEEWGAVSTTREESLDVLAAYLDRGGNFLDTANIYTKGHSEKIIGDYFADGAGKGRRDRVVIATKFGGNMYPGDPNGGGASRHAIAHQVHDSLRRLRTDHIDLLWAHFQDRHTPIDETMRAMDDLVRAGKVRYLGFSDHPAWVCLKAQYEAMLRGWSPLVAIQIEYSLLQRTPEDDLIPMARDTGMAVTPWSPLRGGVLSGKFRRDSRPAHGETRVAENSPHLNERTYALVDELVAIAAEIHASPAQVALNWVQTQPGVTSTIIGAKRLSQLEDNLGALDISLTPEHRFRLAAKSGYARHFPHNFLDNIGPAVQNGATVNGQKSDPWPLSPKNDSERH